jgi:hypothetical protein
MTRGFDKGPRAPRTGRVVPVDVGWRVECYTCQFATAVTTRALAIKAHIEHVQNGHRASETA